MKMTKARRTSNLQYFLVLYPKHEVCGHVFNRRWIEVAGFEVYKFFSDVVITTPMSAIPEQLHSPICFGNDKARCLFEKAKLNSEIVKAEEPDIWGGGWSETYKRTHK